MIREIVAALLLSAVATPVSAAVTRTELAGRSLTQYPFFQFVRSFDPLAKVELAIDPGRFPQITGSTCHMYVTAARSASEWSADPALVDVRTTGFQTRTFSGSTIQANRQLLTGAGQLVHDDGSGFGVGYDVVLDCNLNGALDDGDFIDGGGAEAGMYRIPDTTMSGPQPVVTADYTLGLYPQRVFYPAGIATLGRLPLVVVSHGWTLEYTYYDHIGEHLASHGYIVMSHWNDVGAGNAAGTNTAAVTTLVNTDNFIGSQASILEGVLNGHVDSHRITWMGHSTGGEGVVRAYARLRAGDFTPQHYDAGDIVLIDAICPVAFLSSNLTAPRDVAFHMFAGAADTDTANAPWPGYVQLLTIYERSRGNRQLTYVQGAGHGYFNDVGESMWAYGPDLIGRAATHKVVRGYVLPLVELYVKGNPAAKDFFTRPYDSFRPAGVPANVIIATEYKDADAAGSVVIDDYQAGPEIGTSSSGGGVSFTVANVAEPMMLDHDELFSWTGDPGNGLTRVLDPGDDERCVVFDWSPGSPGYYALEVIPALRDWSDDGFLSFRAAQGTRHPETVALDGPLSFAVTLRDGSGAESTIRIENYGRLTRPYQRDGYGPGFGWANEFKTIRIRLTDFLNNGSGLDLTDVAAVRFDFGSAFGSPRGRIALDDVEVTDPSKPPLPTLTLTGRTGSTVIRWPAAVGGLVFDVYRGTIPIAGFRTRGGGYATYDHTCYEPADSMGDGPFLSTDTSPIPVDRAGFYYLVTVEAPSGESSAGDASVDLDPGTQGGQLERPLSAPCP